MGIQGTILNLNVQWAGFRDTEREDADGFHVLENRTTRSKNLPDHQQDEIVVTVETENAAFVEKQEGLLTRWVSSVFFPPTYTIGHEQIKKMQMTNVDRGFVYPTTIEDQLLLVIDGTKEVRVKFSAIYIPAKPKQPPQQCLSKVLTINPDSFREKPYIQITLEKNVFARRDEDISFNIYDHPPTLEEKTFQMIASGAGKVSQVAASAAAVSQVAATTTLSMSQTAAQFVRSWLPGAQNNSDEGSGDTRDNCCIS